MTLQKYDLIGDIHGHADQLKALLKLMGYAHDNGCYRHTERKVIFLGDFIDRGHAQKDTLDIVMDMHSQGQALAVMGNHEFNALAFHTKHPEKPGTWLRPRTDKNLSQHLRFLDEFLGNSRKNELEKVLKFFWSLPLWLDLGDLRVIHACWEPNMIEILDHKNRLTPELLVQASTKGTDAYQAIEALLKGVEYELPAESTFADKDGHLRNAVRTRWRFNKDANLADLEIPKGTLDNEIGTIPVSANEMVGYPTDAPPVFIGHYWMEGVPELMAHNVACLDYSVAKKGKLTAYRWDGENTLSPDKFIHVSFKSASN